MQGVSERLVPMLDRAAEREGLVVFLTGAGVAAESGIPTFNGPDLHWRVGSRMYHPVELATWMTFHRMPADIWGWYLYRRARCRTAEPNAAHRAIAHLERRLGDRFLLITENVDGLHLRAGNTPKRTYEIHGNLNFVRCSEECRPEVFPLPEDFAVDWGWDRRPGEAERLTLSCRRCGGWLRPNVLWYDEHFDEERFRSTSALTAASDAALFVVVGANGGSLLPTKMCETALARRVLTVAVDPDATPIAELTAASSDGLPMAGKATTLLPPLCDVVGTRMARPALR